MSDNLPLSSQEKAIGEKMGESVRGNKPTPVEEVKSNGIATRQVETPKIDVDQFLASQPARVESLSPASAAPANLEHKKPAFTAPIDIALFALLFLWVLFWFNYFGVFSLPMMGFLPTASVK